MSEMHRSDCAMCSAPAYPAGECNCQDLDAAETAALRARVAELEAEVDNKAAQAWRDGADDATATWQRDITAWRQKAEALEASRARLAAYIRADDDAEYAASYSGLDDAKAKQAAAWAARSALLPADLETPHD